MMTRMTAIACATMMLAAPFAQAQDAEKGEKLFKRCTSCHMIGDGAKNRTGPVLTEVVGRVAGTYEGYKYGKSIVAAGEAGLVWDEDNLFEYIADPRGFLKEYLNDPKAKAKMTFRLKKEDQRRDVIAYLATFSPEPEEVEEEIEAEVEDGTEAAEDVSSE